ncbi:putative tetratricopeptide-like helical domain superfamily [Helianthus anomalus]
MYSKCGDLNKALEVFNSADYKDVFIWSAMIIGLAMHGHGRDAIKLFEKMHESNINGVTFKNILCVCTHTGLLQEGRDFFKKMDLVYKITPCVKHYACRVWDKAPSSLPNYFFYLYILFLNEMPILITIKLKKKP